MIHAEIRKLHLIEEVLKIENEQILSALEVVLKKTLVLETDSQNSFAAWSGIWSNEEAQEIKTAIVENCEQINQDDWK